MAHAGGGFSKKKGGGAKKGRRAGPASRAGFAIEAGGGLTPPRPARDWSVCLPLPQAAPAADARLLGQGSWASPVSPACNGQLVELKQQGVHSGCTKPSRECSANLGADMEPWAAQPPRSPWSIACCGEGGGQGQMPGRRREPSLQPTAAPLKSQAAQPVAAIGSQGIPLGSGTMGIGQRDWQKQSGSGAGGGSG